MPTERTCVTRFLRALADDLVAPPVTGLSFVEPGLLPGETAIATALALTRACARAGLDFAFVPSWEPWALDAVKLLSDAGVASAWVVGGVLWPALDAIGVAEGLRDAARGGDALAPAMDVALERAILAAETGIGAGATALVIADDLAGSDGPLLGPAFLRADVFPRLARIIARADAAGIPAVLHCDGDARLLMPDMVAAGFVAIHGDAGGGTSVLGALEAARAAGLTFIGGIPTATLASDDAAHDAGQQSRGLVAAGGLIVADDGGVTTSGEADRLLSTLRAVSTAG